MTAGVRLFVAFDLPIDARRRLQDEIEPLRSQLEGARWTPVENQHVTVKFLGWCDGSQLTAITELCRKLSSEKRPADLELRGLGAFPSERKASVLWAGIHDPAGVAADLASALDEGASASGFETEKRRFTPHLTLARFRQPIDLRTVLEGMKPPTPSTFSLDQLVLYRSHLSPKGARYEELERFPLGPI